MGHTQVQPRLLRAVDDLQQATWIPCRNDNRLSRLDVLELAIEQIGRHLRLGQRVRLVFKPTDTGPTNVVYLATDPTGLRPATPEPANAADTMALTMSRFLEYAARARANPHFDLEERDHRLDIAQRMRGMIDGAREGSLLPQPGVRTVFRGQYGGRPYSLTGTQQNRWLQVWANADGESLMRGLLAFTEPGQDAEGRFDAFARRAEEAQAAGTIEADDEALLALGSLFNFGAEPDSLPVVRADLYRPLERVLGCELPPGVSVSEQYRHHLGVARRLRAEMEEHGIPVRDMIDAQSIIWLAAEEQTLWAEEQPATSRDAPESYLAICAIYRDEAPYLKEWIEFHRLMTGECLVARMETAY